ncbi:helix-turn-helix domain-containing protein [Enterococcus rivorum]|uniref:helix-turn-helix domain-containing protein n=1 Tax=Enterococcus rivorum TaxID=762845 RepID=UPI001112D2D6|nr:hypothetical protein [Enterococcus rivorum]
MSKSKLKYTFLCLEEDLKEFGNFKVLIEASAQKVDTLHVTAALIDNLRLFYAKKSGMFLLFDAIVVSDISSSEFEKRYFFSRTKVFNLRKKLESLLNEVGITLEMQKLIGEEKAIRKFIFEVYYYYFNGLEFPFPSNVKINVEKTKNSLISIFECDHRPTKMKQLELFIGVCFLRIKWQYFLTESVLNLELFDSFQYKSMRDHILKQVTFPIENRSNTVDFELDFLLAFMTVENIFLSSMRRQVSFHEKKETQLTTLFLEIVDFELTVLKGCSVPDKKVILEKLKRNFQTIHRRLLCFILPKYAFNYWYRNGDFEEMYPEFHRIATRFMSIFDNFMECKNFFIDKSALYYDYMVSLIVSMPQNYLESPIYVCVDFSAGEIYAEYVFEKLNHLKRHGIQIQHKIDNKTDIYLSDHTNNKLLCKQIVFQNPPKENQWQLLKQTVLDIKKTKSSNEKNSVV